MGEAYWEKDPVWPIWLLGGFLKKTFGGLQKPHQVDSSFFIPHYQQRGIIRTLGWKSQQFK